MVSGSQLQVAKLAQVCPAAPSSGQTASGAQRQPGSKPGSKSVSKHKTVPTSAFLEHIILFTSFLKKKEKRTLHPSASDWNLEAPKEPKKISLLIFTLSFCVALLLIFSPGIIKQSYPFVTLDNFVPILQHPNVAAVGKRPFPL